MVGSRSSRSAASRRPQRWPALGVAALVAAAGGIVAIAAPAQAIAGELNGLVYVDYAGNGVFDTGSPASSGIANDVAYAGVTVTAYDAQGVVVGTATTTGTLETAPTRRNYTLALDADVADGDPLRVEFTGLPEPLNSSFAGADDGTSVQFVTAGAESVDYGVLSASDYNPGDPGIATAIQYAGLPTSVSGVEPAVVATAWGVAPNVSRAVPGSYDPAVPAPLAGPLYNTRTVFATFADVGAVGSLAYDAEDDELLIAATYKRMSGLKETDDGGLGLGGIYLATDILTDDGAIKTPASIGGWLDVTTLGVDVGQGLIQSNAERGLGAPNLALPDLNAFQLAGRVGIGGMAVDPGSRVLYFLDLFDQTVYGISLDTRALVGSWPTPAGDDQQGWALTIKDGTLYVGYNDTGDTPFVSALDAGMNYYVASATIAADGELGAFATVLTGSLAYQKGNPIYNWQGAGATVAQQHPQLLRWNSWTDDWTVGTQSVGFQTDGAWAAGMASQVYPQPLLSSLAIDSSGYLTLGFQDRTSIQGGNRNVAAQATPPPNIFYETVSAGDMLLAAPNGDGTYSAETDGIATGAGTSRTLDRTGATPPVRQPVSGEGPGGDEFYYDRQDVSVGETHREASLGAVITAGGVSQVASTLMDPLDDVRVTGVAWFNSADGAPVANGMNVKGYQHTTDTGATSASTTFQKGGGMGALALLVEEAPVEIGNRVWLDADLNGRQDADEPAINGAPVELYAADESGAPTGPALASTTTQTLDGEPGTYYFRSEDATDGVPGFTKDGDYVVVFPAGTGAVQLAGPNATDAGFAGLTWDQLQRTAAAVRQVGAGATGVAPTALNDSNPDVATGYAPVTVGGPAENDHTIDAGWYGVGLYEITKTLAGTPGDGIPSSFTVAVASAENFRGTDRLSSGGPWPVSTTAPSDPQVTEVTFTVAPGGVATATLPLPYGYRLTFDEPDIPDAAVSIAPDPLVIAPSEVECSTPAVQTCVTVAVTNLYDTFSVEKRFTGGLDADSPELSDAEITVRWTSDDSRTGEIILSAADGWVAQPETADGTPIVFPAGTEIIVEETSATGGPEIGWGSATWSGAGVVPGDDGTATITIGASGPVAAVVTDEVEGLVGTFGIAKQVSGDLALDSPELADVSFTVTASWPAGDAVEAGSTDLVLDAAGGWAADLGADLPAGTEVTLSEAAPSGLPADVEWDSATWTAALDLVDNGDGTATVTIADSDEAPVFTLTNRLEVVPPLPVTGGLVPWIAVAIGGITLLAGLVVLGMGLVRRRRGPTLS